MSEPKANITVPVDVTNPGQFFACCGLLELADRLACLRGDSEGASGCFSPGEFGIVCPSVPGLRDLLMQAKSVEFVVTDSAEADEDEDEENRVFTEPVKLAWRDGRHAMDLDWWEDRSIKPWAGSMKAREILRAMLDGIDESRADPFSHTKVVSYHGSKKEPFYFDPRRGCKSHPLDCGFSPDANKMEAACCPALEALCFIGLQRARPKSLGRNKSRYTVWPRLAGDGPWLSAALVGPVVAGAVPIPGSKNLVFSNYFRTDQRKHKTYSQATAERNNYA